MHSPSLSSQDPHIQRTFWRFALPSIAAMLVSGLYQIIDGIFVGHYIGYTGLAAINMVWPIVFVISGLGLLVGMGAGSILSMRRGEGEQASSKAQQALIAGLWLIVIFGLIGSALLFIFGDLALMWQNAAGEVLQQGKEYLIVFAYCALFTVAATALPMLVRNDDNPYFATVLLSLGAIINIVLDYVFVGVLNFGLQGAAIATILAQATITVFGIAYFCSRYTQLNLCKATWLIPVKDMIQSVKLGSSCLIMYLYTSFIVAIHNWLFLQYGTSVDIGAFAIVGYLMSIYYLLAQGVAEGMQPQVSFYYGAQQPKPLGKVVGIATKVILISGFAWTLILNLMPTMMIHLFSQGSPELLQAATMGIHLHLPMMALDGFIALASVYFMSVNQSGRAFLISILNMLIQIPFLIFLPKWFGIEGIWMAMPLSNIPMFIIVAPMVWFHIRQRRAVALAI